jgi:hypothetical protein
MILQCLSSGELSANRLFVTLYEIDPLPYSTDLMLAYLVRRMQTVATPLIEASPA